MRCPKCGYNSFDHLDSCKKCSKDLTEHRAKFNIQSILLSEVPLEDSATVAEEAVAAATASSSQSTDDFAAAGVDDAEDFGFDFMGDSEDDENLAFDELFEEVPTEDEVEESLPAPEQEQDEGIVEPLPLDQEMAAAESSADDFSFDADDSTEETGAVAEESLSEFGFDADEDPDADIFAETEEDFSLDGPDPAETDKG